MTQQTHELKKMFGKKYFGEYCLRSLDKVSVICLLKSELVSMQVNCLVSISQLGIKKVCLMEAPSPKHTKRNPLIRLEVNVYIFSENDDVTETLCVCVRKRECQTCLNVTYLVCLQIQPYTAPEHCRSESLPFQLHRPLSSSRVSL